MPVLPMAALGLAGAVALGITVSLGACRSGSSGVTPVYGPPSPCQHDADCSGEICYEGECFTGTGVKCAANGDCGTGNTCAHGECIVGGAKCTWNSDCQAGWVCDDSNFCVRGMAVGCVSDSDCAQDEHCDSITGCCTAPSCAAEDETCNESSEVLPWLDVRREQLRQQRHGWRWQPRLIPHRRLGDRHAHDPRLGPSRARGRCSPVSPGSLPRRGLGSVAPFRRRRPWTTQARRASAVALGRSRTQQ